MKHNMFLILLLITITNVFDTLRELYLKTAINSLGGTSVNTVKTVIVFITKLLRIPGVWISFICAVSSLFFYLFVLSKVDLNFAFSLDSMHYIFVAFVSHFVLKEKVGSTRWIGTISIIIGIILVTLS
ncbi:MAG: EamA family transporter [Candidatus Omnitrophota bacterium]|nr:EamA family transporter [Candidatus Omnitrophota bacterium]